jgi:glycosyltransferase involved in cell wall biosynthesis
MGEDRRLLVLHKHFTQGHGGAPESTLALARLLAHAKVSVDVVSGSSVTRDVGQRTTLPAVAEDQGHAIDWSDYGALMVVGAWIPRALPTSLTARRQRKRVTYAPRGALARIEFGRPRDIKKYPYAAAIELPVLKTAHNVLFSSRIEAAACVIPKRMAHNIAILPDPYFPPTKTPRIPTAPGVTRFGFIAELSARKGLIELARGFTRAVQRAPHPAIELHIAGDPRPGSERYVEQVRNELSRVTDKVVWYGAVRGEEREKFYATVDCVVTPSKFESYGLTPLEAVARGVPAIVSPTLGILEHIAPSDALYVLRSLSSEVIADALMDSDRLPTATKAASSFSANHFDSLHGAGLATRYAKLLLG